MHYIFLTSAIGIFFLGLISGVYPIISSRKYNNGNKDNMPISECFSAGIFLSLGLFHMLPDSIEDFNEIHVHIAFPLILMALSFVIILILNMTLKSINRSGENYSITIAIVSLLILSIHSFFTGISLGISTKQSQILMMIFAIASHKWAASFTLGYQISTTTFKDKTKWLLIIIFSISTPIGIIFGDQLKHITDNQYLLPTFHAIASGTFLFLGVDHLIDSLKHMRKNKSYKSILIIVASFIFIYLTTFLE